MCIYIYTLYMLRLGKTEDKKAKKKIYYLNKHYKLIELWSNQERIEFNLARDFISIWVTQF